jgi:alanine racemase
VIRFRPTYAEIDLGAVAYNVRAMHPQGAALMAVVKSNGYGHGAVPVARAARAAGAEWLGVALVEEGIALRDAGIDGPVLVLSEFPPGSEKDALAAGLLPTVYTDAGVEAVVAASQALGVSVGVHVKIDTGMHRIGVYPPARAVEFCRRLTEAGCELEGLWTHFAKSEEDEETTRTQLGLFLEVCDAARREGFVPKVRHVANTAAAMLFPDMRFDVVRVGIGVYGIEPAPGVGRELDLRPALSWRSAVSLVRRLPRGHRISYGHHYELRRDSVVATVPVGYADGYPRSLSNRAHVLIRGKRYPVAGTVTMDQLMVDCGDDHIEAGDEVVLIGRQGEEDVGAPELAGLAGTIPYEIVCGISERVPREYVESSSSGSA